MSFNKIFIVGNLGRDPELRYTPQGDAVCNFNVATNERRRDAGGEMQDKTTWFRVSAWGRMGELANQYLKKGSQVFIEGRLSLEEYTDRDGGQRTALRVRASDLQFIERRGAAEQAEEPAGEEGGTLPPPAPSRIPDDDVPF
ncbi:MAG: single-stranded DNA-binding protein [Acidobacteria bacterium]|nr:single-stranded DNA-binding protein [Acidobacteriota bacterium]